MTWSQTTTIINKANIGYKPTCYMVPNDHDKTIKLILAINPQKMMWSPMVT